MVGFALLGAGIFAKERHLPALEAAEDVQLLAIYSRSKASAEGLASEAKSNPDIYYDSPAVPGKSLADLLARADVAAVVVCLPILKQPETIRQALTAGKHVLSEKPVGKDLATARSLIAWHAALPDAPLWAVAENFRFMKPLHYAADKVKEVGGKLVTFHLKMNGFVRETDKYFNTEWRKVPEYQGGFLLDGGVHFVAALRFLLGAAGDEVKQLTCFSSLLEEKLLPVDTVHAVLATRGGANGTLGISFGTEFKSGLEVEIVTTKGAVTWTPTEVKVVRKADGGDKAEEKESFGHDSGGVDEEDAVFARSIAAGAVDPLQTPEEAVKDLEILQALLESGEAGAGVKTLG